MRTVRLILSALIITIPVHLAFLVGWMVLFLGDDIEHGVTTVSPIVGVVLLGIDLTVVALAVRTIHKHRLPKI